MLVIVLSLAMMIYTSCGGDVPNDMILIPAGEFTMGSNDGEIDERPVHTVFLDDYLIDKYEVSNVRYAEFMEATGHEPPKYWNDPDLNRSNQPVVGVSWFDAQAYCKWAGKRLPMEAEWEKAARGTDGRTYPWGEGIDSSRLNYGRSAKRMSDVGSYPAGASPYGVMDMAGNALEWVQDWYSTGYYSVSPYKNPKGPSSGKYRTVRGGSWAYSRVVVRSSIRFGASPDGRGLIGFRCAKDR